MTGPGVAWRGRAWSGSAGFGLARHGRRGEAGLGEAVCGGAGLSSVWPGKAGQGNLFRFGLYLVLTR